MEYSQKINKIFKGLPPIKIREHMRISNKSKNILNVVLLFLLILLTIWLINSILFQQSEPIRWSTTIQSSGTISGEFVPYLVLQISPPGYPVIGETWKINVFVATDFGPILEPATNVSVTATLLSSGKKLVFTLPVDENGEVRFDYQKEFTDIAFQAQGVNITDSKTIILTTHFVQSQDIENPLFYSGITLILSVSSVIVEVRKERQVSKLRRILENSLIILDLALLSFVVAVSLYSRMFLGTVWGYPENIIEGLITVTLLKYVFYVGFMMFLGIMIYKMLIFFRKGSNS